MKFNSGDIVRFNRELGIDGLYEIVNEEDDEGVMVTNDECHHERYAYKTQLIFVCSVKDRKDI